MKQILSILFFLVLFITSCSDSVSTEQERPKTPEELKMELKNQELNDPTTYLSAENVTMTENKVKTREAGLFRDAEYKTDGYFIEGNIKNTATIAKYKDVILTVTLFSQTETVIEEKDYVVYEFYAPNSVSSFSFKINPPSATNKFNVAVKGAKPAN